MQSLIINSDSFSKYSSIIPYLHYCAEDKYMSPWELQKRSINDYEILLITKGEGKFIIGGEEYNVHKDSLILLKPKIFHLAQSQLLPFEFLCIHFDLYVTNTQNKIEIKNHDFHQPIPSKPVKYYKAEIDFPNIINVKDTKLVSIFLRRIISECYEKHYGYNSIIQSIFSELLVILFREIRNIEENKISREVEDIYKYVELNYFKKICLDDLSSILFLQQSYISRLFKKATGYTITEYIKGYRIGVSKNLLIETDRKIEDIAESTGFYDMHHFIRVFKEQVGLTPTQFRAMKRF